MRKSAFFVALLLALIPCLTLAEGVPQAAPAIDLTPVLQAVITLLAALITYRLIPWIRARTTEQQQANLAALASTLVYGAEQLFGAAHGEDKLNYVTDALKASGYDVDSKAVRAAIEAAVHQLTPTAYLFDETEVETVADDEQSGAD